jgi:hypothetical protein
VTVRQHEKRNSSEHSGAQTCVLQTRQAGRRTGTRHRCKQLTAQRTEGGRSCCRSDSMYVNMCVLANSEKVFTCSTVPCTTSDMPAVMMSLSDVCSASTHFDASCTTAIATTRWRHARDVPR